MLLSLVSPLSLSLNHLRPARRISKPTCCFSGPVQAHLSLVPLTAMSLKVELETWAAALKAYDDENFEKALELFNRIADSSKILTNMGLIYATIGEHELAVDQFNAATTLDQYLAVA